MHRLRLRKPSPAMLVAVVALIIALAGTATAAFGPFKGDKIIKKRSLSGGRLKNHTITRTQLNLSKLGKLPNAARADFAQTAGEAPPTGAAGGALSGSYPNPNVAPLPAVQRISVFEHGWADVGLVGNPAGYYKDQLGIVHLTGSISSGTVPAYAFTLPPGYQDNGYFASGSSDGNQTSEGPCTVLMVTGHAYVMSGCDNREVSLEGITYRPTS